MPVLTAGIEQWLQGAEPQPAETFDLAKDVDEPGLCRAKRHVFIQQSGKSHFSAFVAIGGYASRLKSTLSAYILLRIFAVNF